MLFWQKGNSSKIAQTTHGKACENCPGMHQPSLNRTAMHTNKHSNSLNLTVDSIRVDIWIRQWHDLKRDVIDPGVYNVALRLHVDAIFPQFIDKMKHMQPPLIWLTSCLIVATIFFTALVFFITDQAAKRFNGIWDSNSYRDVS